jgi:hypothetical protein
MTSLRFDVLSLGAVALVGVSVGTARASVSQCTGGEFSAAGRKVFSKAMCFSRAVNTGAAVSGSCLSDAEGVFATRYMTAEAFGDCRTTTDAATIEVKIDDFITTVLGDVNANASGPSRCDAKKIHDVGVKARAEAKCYGRAAKHTRLSTDPNSNTPLRHCLRVGGTHFGKLIAAAELAVDCTHTGQAASLEGDVDSFVGDLTSELVPPP